MKSPLMSPEELIHIALQEEIEIESHIDHDPIELLGVDIPQLRTLDTVCIPLFIALHFQSFNMCKIKHPVWLDDNYVRDLIEQEGKKTEFVLLPKYFFEFSYIFPSRERDGLIEELLSIRLGKIMNGWKGIDGRAIYINGLTFWEFNRIRDIFCHPIEFGNKIKGRKYNSN